MQATLYLIYNNIFVYKKNKKTISLYKYKFLLKNAARLYLFYFYKNSRHQFPRNIKNKIKIYNLFLYSSVNKRNIFFNQNKYIKSFFKYYYSTFNFVF